MDSIKCNIEKRDRINRAVIGVLIFLAALVGAGPVFFMLIGLILVVEGAIGWCGIPYVVAEIKKLIKK